MSYGLYVLVIGAVLASGVFVLRWFAQKAMVDDVGRIVGVVQELFVGAADYSGLDEAQVIVSGRLPERMVVGARLWAGRTGSTVRVFLAPGTGSAVDTALGASSSMYFLVGVGDDRVRLEDVTECMEFVMADWPGLQGVQVREGAAAVAAIALAAPGLGVAGGGYSETAIPGSVYPSLAGRDPSTAVGLCRDVAARGRGVQVVYAVR